MIYTTMMAVLVATSLFYSTNAIAYETHTDKLLDFRTNQKFVDKKKSLQYVDEKKLKCNILHIEFTVNNNLLRSARKEFNILIQERVAKLMSLYIPHPSNRKAVFWEERYDNFSKHMLHIAVDVGSYKYSIDVVFGIDDIFVLSKSRYQLLWYGGVRNSDHTDDMKVILEKLWLILDDFVEYFFEIPCDDRFQREEEKKEEPLLDTKYYLEKEREKLKRKSR